MTTLIFGSIAYDTLSRFNGDFDKSCGSLVSKVLIKDFGGCGANIAFYAKQLGLNFKLLSVAGSDFEEYSKHFKKHRISTKNIKILDKLLTAQCFIISDSSHNQIVVYHPGATTQSHKLSISKLKEKFKIAIISPGGHLGSLKISSECSKLGIPFIFDPGQEISLYSKKQFLKICSQAKYLIINKPEGNFIEKNICEFKRLLDLYPNLVGIIQTLGSKGCTMITGDGVIDVPSDPLDGVVDTTACGDAFRASVLYGMDNGWDWGRILCFANRFAGLKATSVGAQNFRINGRDLRKLLW